MDTIDLKMITDYKLWVEIKKVNDLLWVYSSKCVLVPSMIIAMIKIYQYRKGKADLSPTLLNNGLSLTYKILNCYCLIYYTLDTLTYIFLGLLGEKCYQFFLLHHVASVFALANAFHYSKQIFWFEAFVGSMHSLVLTFPDCSLIQYCYFASLLLSHYMLYVKPYCSFPAAKRSTYSYPLAYAALTLMLCYDCLGMLDAEAKNKEF